MQADVARLQSEAVARAAPPPSWNSSEGLPPGSSQGCVGNNQGLWPTEVDNFLGGGGTTGNPFFLVLCFPPLRIQPRKIVHTTSALRPIFKGFAKERFYVNVENDVNALIVIQAAVAEKAEAAHEAAAADLKQRLVRWSSSIVHRHAGDEFFLCVPVPPPPPSHRGRGVHPPKLDFFLQSANVFFRDSFGQFFMLIGRWMPIDRCPNLPPDCVEALNFKIRSQLSGRTFMSLLRLFDLSFSSCL